MRRSTMNVVLSLALLAACSKGDGKSDKQADPPKTAEPGTPATKPGAAPATGDGASAVGVAAGGIQRDADEGAAAVVKSAQGPVEVRRVGETEFSAAKADTKLYPGDVVRTGEAGSATVALADESIIEVAEVTTVAITSRHGSADPASGAAVLGGLARFSVSARAPGEGAFRVYTPAGVVLTKGTVFGVGVAASGEARVGVESGAVDVIGLAALDAKPVMLEGGASVVLAAGGEVGSPAPWPADDWGTWRDDADAKLEVSAAFDAHAAALARLDARLLAAYADLDASADSIATFEATAAASADKGDTATYEASLPDGSATIDASFGVAGQVELLTWAYASHATLATDLYVRHPATVEAQWTVLLPRVDAAVLWPKRYEVTAVGYLEPLRMQYYVHHPRGRVHAELVGVTVPEFYAKVAVPQIEAPRIRSRVKTKIWIAPEVRFAATARPVWVTLPPANWHASFKVAPAAFRANGGWYMRPPTLKSKLLLGTNVTGSYKAKLKVDAPQPRANLRAAWAVPVGMKVKIGAPDLSMAAKARGNIKLNGGGRLDASMRGAGDLNGKGKLDVKVPDVKAPDLKAKVEAKVKVPTVTVPKVDVRGGVKAGFNASGGARADGAANTAGQAKAGASGGAAAKVKVQVPEVKIKAPEVKLKGEAKGKIKLGM